MVFIGPNILVFLTLFFYSWACLTTILAAEMSTVTQVNITVPTVQNLTRQPTNVAFSSLPSFSSTRLILWEKCKPANGGTKDGKNKCCRGNYPCSHPHCRKTSACSMPFFKTLMWCFHDSCPKESKPLITPRLKKSPKPTVIPTPSSQPHFSNSHSPTPFANSLPTQPGSPSQVLVTHSPIHSTSPLASTSADLSVSCKGVRTRREIRDLSIRERLDWQQALLSLTTPVDGGLSEWDALIQAHVDHGDEAHGGAYFLPWHRLQLLRLEDAIRRTRPNFALPYWDWTIDAENAARSPVWKAHLAGGAIPGGGIVNGAFANLEARLPWPHLITRDFKSNVDYTLPQLWTKADIDAVVRTQPWPEFADAIEAAHALVHVSIGGDMMDTRTAPNDPVFWLLHAFVDAIFDSRIRAHGTDEFAGSHDFVDGTRPAHQSFILQPFGSSVRDAIHTSCVRYAPASIVGRSLRRAPTHLPPDVCMRGKFSSNKTQSVSRCRKGFRVLQSQRDDSST